MKDSTYQDHVKRITAHTPGPWVVDNFIVSAGQRRGRDIAITSGFNGVATDLANARLIAAAPELLEALEALLYSAEAMHEDCASHDGITAEPSSFERARTAIRKARGQS